MVSADSLRELRVGQHRAASSNITVALSVIRRDYSHEQSGQFSLIYLAKGKSFDAPFRPRSFRF